MGRSWRRARRSPGRCCLSASRRASGRRHLGRPPESDPRGRRAGARPSYRASMREADAPMAAVRDCSRSGSPRTGVLTFAYFSIASHVLGRSRGQATRPVVVDHVRDHLGHLQADRTAAQSHDRRPQGTRARTAFGARADRDPGQFRAGIPDRGAGAARSADRRRVRPLRGAVLGAGRGHAWRMPPAISPGAGWRGTNTSGCSAAWC